MKRFSIRYFFVVLLFLGAAHTALQAQPRLGVVWDIPADSDSAQVELQKFHELGISILEIDSLPSSQTWQMIDSLDFAVHGNLDINFPITHTFAQPDSTLITHIERKTRNYLAHSSVTAIGLFNYGNIWAPSFWEAVAPFAQKIKQAEDIDLYHKSTSLSPVEHSLMSFAIINVPVTPENVHSEVIPSQTGSFLYSPSEELNTFLKPFKNFITTISQQKQSTIFVSSGWLLMMIDRHPHLQDILASISSEEKLLFPLPKENMPTPNNPALPLIILLLIWGSVALHYNSSPLYRKSLFRYFTSHKFFIDDIFKRLIRSPMPAIIIIVQNALLLATSVYVALSILITPMGWQAFFHHFPTLAIITTNPLAIFLWIVLGLLLIAPLSITWLYVSHKKIKSFTQIATVYAWPLQINFLFCTIIITSFSTSASGSAIFFTALALLLTLASFIFTALDINRFSRSKIKYMFKTVVPYLIIVTGLIIWIGTHDQWIEAISLALNLT